MSDEQLIKDSVRRLYEARAEYKRIEEYYKAVREKESLIISNYMFAKLPKNQSSFEIYMDEGSCFYTNKTTLKVSRQRRHTLTWFADRLKASLSKSVFSQVVGKTYKISDFDGLVGYLKKCGVDPKIFKKYIEVEYSVKQDELNRLYEIGELQKKDIEGCFELKYGEPFIVLKENDKTV